MGGVASEGTAQSFESFQTWGPHHCRFAAVPTPEGVTWFAAVASDSKLFQAEPSLRDQHAITPTPEQSHQAQAQAQTQTQPPVYADHAEQVDHAASTPFPLHPLACAPVSPRGPFQSTGDAGLRQLASADGAGSSWGGNGAVADAVNLTGSADRFGAFRILKSALGDWHYPIPQLLMATPEEEVVCGPAVAFQRPVPGEVLICR